MSRFVPIVLIFALAGCGGKFTGTFELGQWTPTLTSSATSGFTTLDIDAGVQNDDSFYTFDTSFFVTGRGAQNPGMLNLGYFAHKYSGASTTAEYELYKIAFAEPHIEGSSQSSLRNGIIGVHILNYDISGTGLSWADQAMMLVFGWGVEYESGGLMYYVKAEGMDLDVITLGNVGGSLLETSAGVRYTFANSAAISVGYRDYDADLEIRDDDLILRTAGTTVSFYMKF